jgi:death-on-curing protein
LLESACGIPMNRWWYTGEHDIVALAVALLFGIARNHPFVQGNKRTGFMAALQFLGANGLVPDAMEDPGILADLIVAVLEGREDESVVTAHLSALLTSSSAP